MSTLMHNFLKIKKRVTLFDIIVAISVLCLLLFILVFFAKKNIWTTIELKVQSHPTSSGGQLEGAPSFWLVKNIKPGDSQLDGAGKKIASVESVKRWGDMANETWITVKIKARKDKSNIIRFNYQDVAIGIPIKFQFDQYAIEGIVTHIDGMEDKRIKEDKIVRARVIDWSNKTLDTLGVFPWVAASIRKGDTMTTLNDDVVAKILTVDIQNADRVVTTSDGRIVIQKDPSRKDVYLTIKIVTTKIEQTNFFLEDYPVKIDADIPLYFPTYKITPRITEIL